MPLLVQGQTPSVFSFSDYLNQVREEHPSFEQTSLISQMADAKLLKAKGALDPKFTANWDFKQFQGKNYFNVVESKFKVPTITGIEFELGYKYTGGDYFNPERTLPQEGQAFMGLRLPVLQGFLKNDYRTGILQAKNYLEIAKAETQIAQNDFLYEAALGYLDWWVAYNKQEIIREAVGISLQQLQASVQSFTEGDIAAIDTLKAYTEWQTMQLEAYEVSLELEQIYNRLDFFVERNAIQNPQPESFDDLRLEDTIEILNDWSNHPKLNMYQLKLENLDYELQLQRNNALPELGLSYNFLAARHVNFFDSYNGYSALGNYKLGVDIQVPILNRKNRAAVQLADLKYQSTELERATQQRALELKGNNYAQQIKNYQEQSEWAAQLLQNYENIFQNELIKYNVGESTLLFVNTRKQQFVQAQLKYLSLRYKYLKALLGYANLSVQYNKF